MGGVCGRLCKSVKGEGLMQRCFRAGCGEQNQSPKPSGMPVFSVFLFSSASSRT